jgi:hypothetical protein
MNDKRLLIYLNDHLALMVGEGELAARCRASNKGTGLAEFLQQLQAEIGAQKAIVEDLIRRLNGRQSRVKQGAVWVAEKLGRFKFNDSLLKYSGLSRLIELQALEAAAQERVAMWETLELALKNDARAQKADFGMLRDRSHQLLEDLSQRRRTESAWAFVDG